MDPFTPEDLVESYSGLCIREVKSFNINTGVLIAVTVTLPETTYRLDSLRYNLENQSY